MSISLQSLDAISEKIVDSYEEHGGINHIDKETLPSREPVVSVLEDLLSLIFPGYVGSRIPRRTDLRFFVDGLVNSIYVRLHELIYMAYQSHRRREYHASTPGRDSAREDAHTFLGQIPAIREVIKQDVESAYEGDPAAQSIDEVITCYPCVLAITVYRVAHELYQLDVPLIPRIMAEFAHHRTGIDIHPGATIAPGLFIDHGTGVVIGETSIIGENVKIYQGVTLGGLSMHRGPQGELPQTGKRHPTLEDDVTVYAGATILGGDTVIGKGALIGANVWLTESVSPGSVIAIEPTNQTHNAGS